MYDCFSNVLKTPIHANYTLHGRKLTVVECAKYLEISVDSKSCFNQHVDIIISAKK